MGIIKGWKLGLFGTLAGIGVIALGFQNCSPARFIVDPAAKNQTLANSPVFSGNGAASAPGGNDGSVSAAPNLGGNDGGTSGSKTPNLGGTDGGIPGSTTPTSGTGSNLPGNDIGIPGSTAPTGSIGSNLPGNDIGIPGSTAPTGSIGSNLPGNDIGIPGTSGAPGTSGSSGSPGTPGSSGSKTPSTNIGSNLPGSDSGIPTMSSGNQLTFTLMCVGAVGMHAPQTVINLNSDVKLIITQQNSSTVICEKDNVLSQVTSGQPIDISSCGLAQGTTGNMYLVSMSDNSNYSANSALFSGSTFMEGAPGSYDVAYTVMSDTKNNALCGTNDDPLLIQLHTSQPEPITLTAPQNGVMFDLLGNLIQPADTPVLTSWFAESHTENYFLALPNANGQVLGINQLFGNATLGPDGHFASQGFAALAKYDADGDSLITAADPIFSQLRLWKDDNLDGVAQPSELHTLAEKGVVAIDLHYDSRYSETDKYGNIVKYKSVVIMSDSSYGLVYDLWLRYILK